MEPSFITFSAVGVWFYSLNTHRYLYLLRNDSKYPGAWGLPGGKVESGENLLSAIERECCEELGFCPTIVKLLPIAQFTSGDNKFVYHTFFGLLDGEFIPNLNNEHLGYTWIDSSTMPTPLHPGLWTTVNLQEVKQKIQIIERLFVGGQTSQ